MNTWGPPSLLYNGYRVFPSGEVRPGRDADPSPTSSANIKNGVELYLYSQLLWDRGPVNSFFIRRGPGPNKFPGKYRSNLFKFVH